MSYELHPQGHHVFITNNDSGERVSLSWSDAQLLHKDLGKMLPDDSASMHHRGYEQGYDQGYEDGYNNAGCHAADKAGEE